MITCALADDEELARKLLSEYIKKAGNLALVSTFSNGSDVLAFLERQPVDVVFLDINMPGLSGLDVLRSLTKKPVAILTTAYSEYALEGFELDVIDYLQKPFSYERFLKAKAKAEEYISQLKSPQPTTDYFFVKSDYKIVKIETANVLYIEGLSEYVRIHTHDKKIITLLSLNILEEKLQSSYFLRVHRSFIVNFKNIDSYQNNMLEIGKQQIPVGQSYKQALLDALQSQGIY